MPAQPFWFHRLEEIIAELDELPVSHLDRLAVERLFGVRQRRARQLMAGLPGLQVGNAFAVDRLALLARLSAIASGDAWQREQARRVRLTSKLEQTRRQLAARRVPLPAPSPDRSLGGLDTRGITLRPGHLHILFSDAIDLAAKLFELSQVMANDWPAFTQAVESQASLPPRRNW